jgi:putative flippase GtrA
VLRFLVAGGGSLGLDIGLQWLLRAGLGLSVWLAPALSYEIALLVHYLVNNRWVFGERRTSLRRLVQFHAAALTGAAITLGVTYVLVSEPVVPYFVDPAGPFGPYGPEVAKLIGAGIAFFWNFTSSFFWIWRPRALPR